KWSARQIAIHFNRLGVKNNLGREWSIQRIGELLKNEVYTGTLVFGRQAVGEYGRIVGGEYTEVGRRAPKRIKQRRDQCIVVEDAHPAIVSRYLWEKAQERFRERATLGQRSRRKASAVSGLLWCGHCGSKMGLKTVVSPSGAKNVIVRCNSNNFNTSETIK